MTTKTVLAVLVLAAAGPALLAYDAGRDVPGGEWAYPRPVPYEDAPPTVVWGPCQVPDLRSLQWGFYGMSYWGLKEQLHACYFWQNQIHRYRSVDSTNPSLPDTIPMATIPSPVSDSFQDLSYCRYDQSVWLHSSKYKAVYKLDAATGLLKRQFPSPALRYPTGIAFNEREKRLYVCDRMPEGTWPCSLYVIDTTGYVLARHGLDHLGYSYSGARCLDFDYTNSNPNWPTLLLTYTFFSSSGTLDSTVLFELDRNTIAVINRFKLPNLAGYTNNVRGVAWDPRSGDYWIGIMQNPDNQIYKLDGWHQPLSLDAGLMSLEGPRGTIDSATTVTPHVTVRNFGTTEADIPVRLRIGTVYDETRTKAIRGGAEDTVMFASWTPSVVGTYPVSCTVNLAGDMFEANDTWTEIAQVVRAGRDVSCNEIIAPAGFVDSGVAVVPRCSVYNYGSQTVSYSVRMRIGAGYDETTFVAGHLPGNFVVCSLAQWIPVQTGNYAVSCSTQLTGDRIPSNDRDTGTVTARTQDVGVTQILQPVGTIDSGIVVYPRATVWNYGIHASSFSVGFRIATPVDTVYEDTAWVVVGGGDSLAVDFAAWTAGPVGTLRVESYTELWPDVNRANDTARSVIVVRRPVSDVGAVAILAPSDTVDTGASIVPAALVRNFGERAETFPVRFRIGAFYSHDTSMTLPVGVTDTVRFAAWHVGEPGIHAVSCSTMLAGDMNAANDEVEDSVVVVATGIAGGRELPTQYALQAAQPNPFTGRTTMCCALPRDGEVSVLVYNSAGLLVAKLAGGTMAAGYYNLVWDGHDLGCRKVRTGIYYCRMTAGDFTQTRKLLRTE